MPRALGVIPARYASTRYPGKPLATLGNQTIVEQVWRRVRQAERLDRVIVATDDRRIADAVRAFGGESMMTSDGHPSGTDRVAEVVGRIDAAYEVVVNVQGDEPLVTPSSLDRLVAAFEDASVDMATLSEPIDDAQTLFDPNVVKLVTATDGRALYFSRSAIPYHRGSASRLNADFRAELPARGGGLGGYRKHQGIYAYRRDVLLRLTSLPPSPLELDEGLEQLRALQAGVDVRVVESDFVSLGVDTPEDLQRVARFLSEAP